MRSRIFKREAAKRDLIALWLWYAEHADTDVADRFLRAAEETLSVLSNQPESGMRCCVRNARLRELRRFPVSDGFERILLFNLPIRDGVDLVRVVHGNRNLTRLLAEGFFG